jgi:hypothetical protein
VTPEPVGPRPPYGRWQDELVEQSAELLRIDAEADVVLGALTQHLLVDANRVCVVLEVLRDPRTAPADLERQLDDSAGLRERRFVEVLGYRDRPSRRPEIAGACMCQPGVDRRPVAWLGSLRTRPQRSEDGRRVPPRPPRRL